MTNLTAAAASTLNAIRANASCFICKGEGDSLQTLLGQVLAFIKGTITIESMRKSVYTSSIGAVWATFRTQDTRFEYDSSRGWIVASSRNGDAVVELGSDKAMRLVQDYCAFNPMV